MFKMKNKIPMNTQDKLQYITRQVADQQIHCVISLHGKIDENVLAKAVRLTLDAEPVLGSKAILHPIRPYWERRDDLDELSLCAIVTINDLDSELSAFITSPSDPCSDPLIQVTIFRSNNGMDTLCIKVNHVAADAGGTRDYVYLLAATYQKLRQNPAYLPTPNINGDRSMRQVFKKFSLFTKLRLIGRASRKIPNAIFPYRSNNTSKKTLVIHQIDSNYFEAMKNFARNHQATLNDFLLAAFCHVFFDSIKAEPYVPIPIQVPIDLRRYLPSGKTGAICNLACALYPSVTPVPNATFESILNQVNQAMNSEKSFYPGLGFGLLLEFIFKKSFDKSQKYFRMLFEKSRASGRSFPMLTNMGQLDPDRLLFGDLSITNAYMVSPIVYPPLFMVGVSTFKGAITLTAGFCESAVPVQVVKEFLSRMALVLQKLTLNN